MSTTTTTKPTARDAVLRGVDVAIALVISFSGFFAIINPPTSVLHAIAWGWLILVWGSMLLLGGGLAAFGRLTGFWFPESLGLPLTMFGTLIYVVVLFAHSIFDIGALAVVALVLAALGAQIHRYIEIQAFTSEPGETTWFGRLLEIMRIRTVRRDQH